MHDRPPRPRASSCSCRMLVSRHPWVRRKPRHPGWRTDESSFLIRLVLGAFPRLRGGLAHAGDAVRHPDHGPDARGGYRRFGSSRSGGSCGVNWRCFTWAAAEQSSVDHANWRPPALCRSAERRDDEGRDRLPPLPAPLLAQEFRLLPGANHRHHIGLALTGGRLWSDPANLAVRAAATKRQPENPSPGRHRGAIRSNSVFC
jgi:hypothetical protein